MVRERLAPALIAVSLALGAVPTAGLAVTAVSTAPVVASKSILPFTPANVDPAIARRVAASIAARGQEMRFTPAGTSLERDRVVTVAIRVDRDVARAISVRSAIKAAQGEAGLAPSLAALSPARVNLGISRGYQSFAKPSAPALDLKKVDLPDLASFRPREGVKDTPGRLQPRIALESESRTGRSRGTLEGAGEQAVDLGAGYRLSRNLNLTAGVRLTQDRDRLAPLTDAVRDDQAVYVGTQFRF
ncbi:hypothetical protein GCM10011515_22850 [Tsuneonella deserti]|uniref:Uncharacterized protein n=1 Tax=Tsuneonella deserti TaxID=2035528 RepID=A0ABQ1SD68_9SPHN|nr:hypothetical protein GCM10011515_22850 [Tsuneonella deserti]